MRHFHFQIIETLYDRFGLPNTKNSIDVVDAGEEARYKNEGETLIEGQPPVSPVFLAYKPTVPYEKLPGSFMVFLSYQSGHLTLAAKSAVESLRKKKQVLRLIKKLPQSQPLDASPKPVK